MQAQEGSSGSHAGDWQYLPLRPARLHPAHTRYARCKCSWYAILPRLRRPKQTGADELSGPGCCSWHATAAACCCVRRWCRGGSADASQPLGGTVGAAGCSRRRAASRRGAGERCGTGLQLGQALAKGPVEKRGTEGDYHLGGRRARSALQGRAQTSRSQSGEHRMDPRPNPSWKIPEANGEEAAQRRPPGTPHSTSAWEQRCGRAFWAGAGAGTAALTASHNLGGNGGVQIPDGWKQVCEKRK